MVSVWTGHGEVIVSSTTSTTMVWHPEGTGVVTVFTGAHGAPVSNVMDGDNFRGRRPGGWE